MGLLFQVLPGGGEAPLCSPAAPAAIGARGFRQITFWGEEMSINRRAATQLRAPWVSDILRCFQLFPKAKSVIHPLTHRRRSGVAESSVYSSVVSSLDRAAHWNYTVHVYNATPHSSLELLRRLYLIFLSLPRDTWKYAPQRSLASRLHADQVNMVRLLARIVLMSMLLLLLTSPAEARRRRRHRDDDEETKITTAPPEVIKEQQEDAAVLASEVPEEERPFTPEAAAHGRKNKKTRGGGKHKKNKRGKKKRHGKGHGGGSEDTDQVAVVRDPKPAPAPFASPPPPVATATAQPISTPSVDAGGGGDKGGKRRQRRQRRKA